MPDERRTSGSGLNAAALQRRGTLSFPPVLKTLTARWFTRPVQISIFVLTELVVVCDMYRHRTHPAQSVAHIVLAVMLALLWWRAARANTRDAYDNFDWVSLMAVSGLSLIPDFIP